MLQSKISFSYLNCVPPVSCSDFVCDSVFSPWTCGLEMQWLWVVLCVIILLLSSWSLSLSLLSPILGGFFSSAHSPWLVECSSTKSTRMPVIAAFFRLSLSIPPVCLRMGLGAPRAEQSGKATPHHPTAYFQALCCALSGQSENGRGWQAKAWGRWLTGLFSAFQI